MGRGTRDNLPNNWDRAVDWKKQIELRGEEQEKRIKKKERIEGKKEVFEEGERVLLQNVKTKKWDTEGIVQKVRIAEVGTISIYEIKIGDHLTTRHRRYMSNIKNVGVEIDDSGNTVAENRARATAKVGSQQ